MIELKLIDFAKQKFTATIKDQQCTFDFKYNSVMEAWTFSLTINGELMLSGRKLVNDIDILAPFSKIDIGIMFSIDPEDLDQKPDRVNLPAGIVRLFVVDEAEYEEALAIPETTVIPPQPPQPLIDVLLDPPPPPFGGHPSYLTFSQIVSSVPPVVDQWNNHIGPNYIDVANVTLEQYINETPEPDRYADVVRVQSNSTIYENDNSGNAMSSAMSSFIVYKPEFQAVDVWYNLVQVGTNNDCHVAVKLLPNGNIQYKIRRRVETFLEVPYTPGEVLGVISTLDKSGILGGRRIITSSGHEILSSNGQIGTGAGTWGLFPFGGRDYITGLVMEAAIFAPSGCDVTLLNRIVDYLNAKWSLNFNHTAQGGCP